MEKDKYHMISFIYRIEKINKDINKQINPNQNKHMGNRVGIIRGK